MRQKRLDSAQSPNKSTFSLASAEALKKIKISVSNPDAIKKPKSSVQHRLKDVCTRDFRVQSGDTDKVTDLSEHSLKQDIPIQKEISPPSQPTVDDKIIEIKDEVEQSKDVSCTFVPNRIIQLANKVQGNRKWKQYEMPMQVDEDGYFKATITDFSTPKLGMQSYIVSPLGMKDQYLTHLRQIQQVYKSTALEPLSLDKIKRYDLVVALFGITWNRAIVLEVTDKVICVRSIEHGTNCFIRDFSKIKAPLPAELQKKGFIIEVVFENENDVEININSIVTMKMMSAISGTNLAALKEDVSDNTLDDDIFQKIESMSIKAATTTEDPIKKEVLNKVEITSTDERINKLKLSDERKYLNKQMIKDFHTGDNLKLSFLDGGQLTNGLAHFCEFLPENIEFYLKIGKLKDLCSVQLIN